MMSLKKKIKSSLVSLREAKVVVNRDDLESVVPSLGDDDVVKVVDEQSGDDGDVVNRILNIVDNLVESGESVTAENIKIASIFHPGGTITDADDIFVNQILSAYNDYDESDYEEDLPLQENKVVRPKMTKNKLIEHITKLNK